MSLSPPAVLAATPTRVRYRVLALVCMLSMLTYLHRVCVGAAAPALAEELGLSATTVVKWAFTAFMISYAVFEIPVGWIGDRYGPRITLLSIVAFWSLCTIITSLVGMQVGSAVLGGLGTLVFIRFLFGAGEAGAYPNIARALYNWFPARHRTVTQGLVWMSGRIMGGLTPSLWAVLVIGTTMGPPLTTWRGAFVLFGVAGLIWCVAFAIVFRNRPQDHPHANEAERTLAAKAEMGGGHTAIPWRSLFGSRTLGALCLMYVCTNFGWYFHAAYISVYMDARYSTANSDLMPLYKGGPLWVGAAGCLAGGFLAERFSRMLGVRAGRAAFGIIAYSLSAICWIAAGMAPNAQWFFICTSTSAFCSDLMMGAIWATCQDIGRRHAGVTAACMNMIGGLGATLALWLTGTLVERAVEGLQADQLQAGTVSGYQEAFLAYACAYAIAAACWLFVNPNKPIQD